ncbi:MAG: PIN domain-containing protein [Nanoarchaeota archaeon]|nr:PIN domain-containing protein [Nanoarchaeota archaeon]
MQNDLRFYYLDTSVWINLFKKEESGKIKFWLLAEAFVNAAANVSNVKVIISPIVMKELTYNLDQKLFALSKKAFNGNKSIIFVRTKEVDYEFARKLEYAENYALSFFDCLHIAISKRMGAALVSRDYLQIQIAGKHLIAGKPEDLIHELVERQ